MLEDLREMFHIPEERHVVEVSAAAQDPLLTSISKFGVPLRRSLFREPELPPSQAIPGDVPTDTELDLPKARRPQQHSASNLATSILASEFQSPTAAHTGGFLSPATVAATSETQLLFDRCSAEQMRAADLAQMVQTCPTEQRPAVFASLRKQVGVLKEIESEIAALPEHIVEFTRPDVLSKLLAAIADAGPSVDVSGDGGALRVLDTAGLLASLRETAAKGGFAGGAGAASGAAAAATAAGGPAAPLPSHHSGVAAAGATTAVKTDVHGAHPMADSVM